MIKKLLVLFLVLLAAAYVAGYWPQHQQLHAAQQSAAQAQQQLASTQEVARICKLENELLALLGQAENQNYGEARNLSNAFFEDLQKESNRDPNASYKADLESILGQRDAITSGLTKADAATITPLKQSLGQMEQLVGKLSSQAGL